MDRESDPRSILLVETDAAAALRYHRILSQHGYDVATESSGDGAIRIARSTVSIDLVLMNIDLGDVPDAAQTAEMILTAREVPIAFLYDHGEARLVEKVRNVKHYGLVLSTAGEAVLLDAVATALELFDAKSEATLELIGTNISDAILYVNADLKAVYWSPSTERISGFSADDLDGCSVMEMVYEEDRPRVLKEISSVIEERSPAFIGEYRAYTRSGEIRWLETRARPLYDESGQFTGAVYVSRDITDQKVSQDRVSKLLEEKDAMLKEVHHRIKNNMTSLEALLSLQAASVANKETTAALGDVKRRVHTMGLLYDRLYESGSMSTMSLEAFLSPMVDEIVSLFPNRAVVAVEKDIVGRALDAKTLSAIGIMVNELITNAMKHAFPGGRSGSIRVTATDRDEKLLLEVSDDGVGAESTRAPDKPAGYGLNLVRMLTEQLHGRLEIVCDGGTRCTLELKP